MRSHALHVWDQDSVQRTSKKKMMAVMDRMTAVTGYMAPLADGTPVHLYAQR